LPGREGETRRRKNLIEAAAALFEVPVDAVAPMPVFTIRGRGEVEAEGCRGILEYTGERVVLSTAEGPFTVTGEGLSLEDFEGSTLRVRGRIRSAAFGGPGGEEES